VRKLFGVRTFLVDCLLSELGWKWFYRVRVAVLIKWSGGVWHVVSDVDQLIHGVLLVWVLLRN